MVLNTALLLLMRLGRFGPVSCVRPSCRIMLTSAQVTGTRSRNI